VLTFDSNERQQPYWTALGHLTHCWLYAHPRA
jgi:hypothetical protein